MKSSRIVLSVLAGGLWAATQASAVDLSTLLSNPGFEKGLQAQAPGTYTGCPIGWNCSGSPSPGATAYSPTAAEFQAGADGLAANLLVPGGVSAALCPTFIEGSCVLAQNGLGTYTAGMTYTLTLWVGTPSVMPFTWTGQVDDKTPTAPLTSDPNGRITFYWMGNGGNQLQATNITSPAVGQWKSVTLSFTPTGIAVGQSIGIMIFASTGNNNEPVVFDIAPPCTC